MRHRRRQLNTIIFYIITILKNILLPKRQNNEIVFNTIVTNISFKTFMVIMTMSRYFNFYEPYLLRLSFMSGEFVTPETSATESSISPKYGVCDIFEIL